MKYIIGLILSLSILGAANSNEEKKNRFIIIPKVKEPGKSSSVFALGSMMWTFNMKTSRLHKQEGFVVKVDESLEEVKKLAGDNYYVEVDRKVKKFAFQCSKPPEPPKDGECPVYFRDDERKNWGIDQSHVNEARVISKGETVVVAVIDTGVDKCHPDIKDRLLPGYNFVSDNTESHDDEGHGTHVAGIISAVINGKDGYGISDARIIPVKVLDHDGSGYNSDVANGISWAADHGATYANLSLGGGTTPSLAITNAIRYAKTKGMTIIAANGNASLGELECPACNSKTESNVIAVAAMDEDGTLAGYSNYGEGTTWLAPGSDILSLKLGGGTVSYSGTSMATPFVAGIYALAKGIGSTPKGSKIVKDPAGRDMRVIDALESVQ